MTQPNRQHAKQYRPGDIRARVQPFLLLKELQGAKAERGESGITPANSDHKKLASSRVHQQSAARIGEGGEKADGQGTADIDQQCAPGKRLAKLPRNEPRKPETRGGPECSTQTNPEIIHDTVTWAGRVEMICARIKAKFLGTDGGKANPDMPRLSPKKHVGSVLFAVDLKLVRSRQFHR